MAIYSSYQTPYIHGTEAVEYDMGAVAAPTVVVAAEPQAPAKKTVSRARPAQTVAPAAIIGFAIAAALMVLLLLTQAQLSSMSFEIDALEREISSLETTQEKLLIAHARAYSLERVEDYAVNVLGMVKPAPEQFYMIETDIYSREEPKTPS